MRSWAFLIALGMAAQASPQIPDKFENLQFFPKDIDRRGLLDAMRGFSFALGLRCEGCHAGEGGPELKNMDFASDEKETKRAARRMLVMVAAIQKEYDLSVGCITCHHGVSRPASIEEVVEAVLVSSGVEAAVSRYRELRKEYYGSSAYDFGDTPLNRLGEKLLRAGETEKALALLELNEEFHPDSAWLKHLLGEARKVKAPEE